MRVLLATMLSFPWVVWASAEVLIEADVTGVVQIQGGPTMSLPAKLPPQARPIVLTVRLDGCPEFEHIVQPGALPLKLRCERPAHHHLLSASREGEVSLDGGPLVALPLWLKDGNFSRRFRVLLADCPPFARSIRPEERDVVLHCPDPTPVVSISGPGFPVEAEARVDSQVVQTGRLGPGETWHIEAKRPGKVTVACGGDGLVPWEWTHEVPPLATSIPVKCHPHLARRFAIVQIPLDDLNVALNGAHNARLFPLGTAERSLKKLPANMEGPPRGGQWYAVQLDRDGWHQLCAQGGGWSGCATFEVRESDQKPATIALTPSTKGQAPARDEAPKNEDTIIIIKGGAAEEAGPLEPGLWGGAAHVHGRTFTAIGTKLRINPGWEHGLSIEAGLLFLSGERPVFLDRFESETRVARTHTALRMDSDQGEFSWFGALGAFLEFEIAMGPWVGGGVAFPLGPASLELGLGVPIFFEDKLGHLGIEALACLSYALPKGGQK